MTNQKSLCLFGGERLVLRYLAFKNHDSVSCRSWKSDDWTASDDRVRGGKSQVSHSTSSGQGQTNHGNYSQSYFDCSSTSGRFHGELDIKTLGGAGFASQRTTGEDRDWNLSNYAGIVLELTKVDCECSVPTLFGHDIQGSRS